MQEQKITPLKQVQPTATRTYRTRSEWKKLLTEWEESGQSQKEFCESRSLCYRNFNQWKSRLKKNTALDQANTTPFIPARVAEKEPYENTGVSRITVDLPNQVKLR